MTQLIKLFRDLRFYQVLCILFFAVILWLGEDEFQDWLSDHYPMSGNVVVEPLAPHADEIRRILAPLKYSAIHHFLDPRTKIVMDPAKGVWGITNLHDFDSKGRILLRAGRFGVCGDLSAYVYDRVKGMFPSPRYSISFLQVAESSFFNREGGTHIMLEIVDHSAGGRDQVYYLDPSFRKYGSPDLFGTYLPKAKWKELDFVTHGIRDQFFTLNAGPPVHINNKVLISLYVGDVDGRFDEDNYVVMLGALKRYEYASLPLLVCMNDGGKKTVTDFNSHIASLMSRGVYDKLKQRTLQLCKNIRFIDDAPRIESSGERKASNMHSLSIIDTENLTAMIRKGV